MALPTISKSRLDVQPVDGTGLPARFLNPGELEVIIALVRSADPQHVIEIGVNVGRTTTTTCAVGAEVGSASGRFRLAAKGKPTRPASTPNTIAIAVARQRE